MNLLLAILQGACLLLSIIAVLMFITLISIYIEEHRK